MKKSATTIAAFFAATALWAGMAHAIGTIQLPKTGQGQAGTCWNAAGTSVSCATTGQDGDKKAGVAWPGTRFTDTGNGTVTDNLTGLIWLKNANCWSTARSWDTALALTNALASGQCALSDGSTAGQWRLPNIKELESLVDVNRSGPALPAAHPFSGVVITGTYPYYWSSTNDSSVSGYVNYIDLNSGVIMNSSVTQAAPIQKGGYALYVWAVR